MNDSPASLPSGDGRRRGTLTDWNDGRGFGFITSTAGGSRVFVHISAFPRGRRPVTGAEVTYVGTTDERGRARAADVRCARGADASSRRLRGVSGVSLALASAAVPIGLLAVLAAADDAPVTLVVAYGLLSSIAFVMYGADKAAAREGTRRTPESSLHTIALLGGWPGALVGQQLFRHKTTKQPFRTVFWVTVVVNCAALAWVLHEQPLTLP